MADGQAAVVRITELRAREGGASSLIEAARANAAAAGAADGCHSADVCAAPGDAGTVLVISRWGTADALHAFLGWHERLAHDSMAGFIDGKPRSTHYQVLGSSR